MGFSVRPNWFYRKTLWIPFPVSHTNRTNHYTLPYEWNMGTRIGEGFFFFVMCLRKKVNNGVGQPFKKIILKYLSPGKVFLSSAPTVYWATRNSSSWSLRDSISCIEVWIRITTSFEAGVKKSWKIWGEIYNELNPQWYCSLVVKQDSYKITDGLAQPLLVIS